MVLLVLAALLQPDPRWDFDRRLGLLQTDIEGACLAIDDDTLKPWTQVFIVRPDERSSRTFAALVERPTGSCPGLPSFRAAYRLKLHTPWAPPSGILGAAVGTFQVEVERQGTVAFRLAPAPTPISCDSPFVRPLGACASACCQDTRCLDKRSGLALSPTVPSRRRRAYPTDPHSGP